MEKSHISVIAGLNKEFKKRHEEIELDKWIEECTREKPTPLDFDRFIPWLCLEWNISQIPIIMRKQEEIPKRLRQGSSTSTRMHRLKSKDEEIELSAKKPLQSDATNFATKFTDLNRVIPVSAYYDARNRLVEVSIVGYPHKIHRKIIQAFNITIPFHSKLTKLTIRRGGLSNILLREISKMLPFSNITDLCFDDSYIPEHNYYVLLDQFSQLRYLSLSRCSIGDEGCKEIAARLDYGCPAEKNLLALDLTSNVISDLGAEYLGDMLRKNRHLLHLNLSGNRITDIGAEDILKHLEEFPLTPDEIFEMKCRRSKYLKERAVVLEECLKEVMMKRQKAEESAQTRTKRLSPTAKHSKTRRKSHWNIATFAEDLSCTTLADNMTKEVFGDFIDIFDETNVVTKNDVLYSIGNFKLCSLNLAYNNLQMLSVRMILKVIKYQSKFERCNNKTGLLRITFDGNNLPRTYTELDKISVYLKKAIYDLSPVASNNKKRLSEKPKKVH